MRLLIGWYQVQILRLERRYLQERVQIGRLKRSLKAEGSPTQVRKLRYSHLKAL